MWMSVVVFLVACSPPVKTDCSALNCAGCCDVEGQCRGGNDSSSCGSSGNACQMCSTGAVCSLGACMNPVTDGGSDAGSEITDAGIDGGGNSLMLTLDGKSGGFDRAYHGVEPDGGIYVEAYFGQMPEGCPMQSTASARTLIIANVNATNGGTVTYADGLRVTFFDFNGDITNTPLVRFTETSATAVDVRPGEQVSFTLQATLDGGVVSGQFTAIHCPVLDG